MASRPRRRWPAAARLIRIGTTSPTVQIRDARGHWRDESICDEATGERVVRRLEAMASWARRQGAIAARGRPGR